MNCPTCWVSLTDRDASASPSPRHDIWIHDCTIRNDDDSIAVKPIHSSNPYGPCSQNMLIENMVISGMGTSIGSVPPHPNHNCIKNITSVHAMPATRQSVHSPNTQLQ